MHVAISRVPDRGVYTQHRQMRFTGTSFLASLSRSRSVRSAQRPKKNISKRGKKFANVTALQALLGKHKEWVWKKKT